MKAADITKLAKKGESTTLELKRSTAELDRAVETLVAFLNAKGGTVLIGVRGNGSAEGMEVADKTRQQVAAAVRQIEPAADVAIEYVEVAPRRAVIKLTCETGSHGPYTVDGRAYIRVDNTTRRMKSEEYEERVLQRRHATDRWELAVARGYTVKDLDSAEILRTYHDAVRVGRLEPVTRPSAKDIAQRLRVVSSDGAALHGAVALFGKRLIPHYMQCGVRLARFRGRDKTEFLDQRQDYAHAFELLELAESFIRKNTRLAGRILPDRFEREDTPEYPSEAVREALVNAICHRDYTLPGGAVSLGIYDDRLEISSPGRLAGGLRVDDLKRDHFSKPRNPLIAEAFYRRGFIEMWGRGTQKIVQTCRAAGSPEPEFEERSQDVVVRFFSRMPIATTASAVPGLSDRQRQVLAAIPAGTAVTPAEISAKAMDLSARTLRRELDALTTLHLIERSGWGRSVRYSRKRPQDG